MDLFTACVFEDCFRTVNQWSEIAGWRGFVSAGSSDLRRMSNSYEDSLAVEP